MNYQEAKELKTQQSHLLGSKDEKGFEVSEILIVPANKSHLDDFLKSYLFNDDAEIAIAPYLNEDLDVWAIDSRKLKEAHVLFYEKLNKDEVKKNVL